jgi:hypothetical protein
LHTNLEWGPEFRCRWQNSWVGGGTFTS